MVVEQVAAVEILDVDERHVVLDDARQHQIALSQLPDQPGTFRVEKEWL